MNHPSHFELRVGALRLALRPDLGGCMAGLWHGQIPIMRSVEPHLLDNARPSANYPLVPYSNRLGHRHFRWGAIDYTTAPNFDANPHSVHGTAWQRAWQVVSSSSVDVGLRYAHEPDTHWPFAFETHQYFSLTPDELKVQLVFKNTSHLTQPVGLGWHPYFPKRERSRLHIELTHRWDNDPTTELPTRQVSQSGIDSDVSHLDFDNCFDGWMGPARIRDEKFSLQLSSSLSRLVIYTPKHKDYFCVEPVSHVSNAIHMSNPTAHGLQSVPPGETIQADMTLHITPV
jgi:aldose 1-epimerase